MRVQETRSRKRRTRDGVDLRKHAVPRTPSQSELTQTNAPLVPPRTVAILFLWRLCIAFTLRTAESPDEWWQSAEVAYYMVFGKGHLTWEWKEGIRSVVFPAFYALPFFVLKLLHVDNAYTIYGAERIVQACIATGIDLTMVVLSSRIDRAIARDAVDDEDVVCHSKAEDEHAVSVGSEYSEKELDEAAMGAPNGHSDWLASSSVAKTTVSLAMLQWYLTCDGARAYSNVAEGLFVMLAVIQRSYLGFLMVAAVACMVRVTAAIALFPVFLYHFGRQLRCRGAVRGFSYCLFGALVVMVLAFAAMMSIDYIFYRRLILTPFKFLEFNIIKNVSQYYGVYPWWWYFVVGFPVMVGPHLLVLFLLPLVLQRLASFGSGSRRTRSLVHWLLGLMIWTLSVHSAVGHKEVRFMFPMLPVALVLASFVIATFVRLPHRTRFSTFTSTRLKDKCHAVISSWHVLCLHRLFLFINVILIVILGYVYRQGGVGVVAAVRHAPVPTLDRVDVLTHCYFTPGYSQVHGKVKELRLIDCPMQLDSVTGKPVITDDILYRQFPTEFVFWVYLRKLPESPHGSTQHHQTPEFDKWLAEMTKRFPLSEKVALPDAVVVFNSVSDSCSSDFFKPHGYRLASHVFHALKSFEEDEDSYVDLWIKDR